MVPISGTSPNQDTSPRSSQNQGRPRSPQSVADVSREQSAPIEIPPISKPTGLPYELKGIFNPLEETTLSGQDFSIKAASYARDAYHCEVKLEQFSRQIVNHLGMSQNLGMSSVFPQSDEIIARKNAITESNDSPFKKQEKMEALYYEITGLSRETSQGVVKFYNNWMTTDKTETITATAGTPTDKEGNPITYEIIVEELLSNLRNNKPLETFTKYITDIQYGNTEEGRHIQEFIASIKNKENDFLGTMFKFRDQATEALDKALHIDINLDGENTEELNKLNRLFLDEHFDPKKVSYYEKLMMYYSLGLKLPESMLLYLAYEFPTKSVNPLGLSDEALVIYQDSRTLEGFLKKINTHIGKPDMMGSKEPTDNPKEIQIANFDKSIAQYFAVMGESIIDENSKANFKNEIKAGYALRRLMVSTTNAPEQKEGNITDKKFKEYLYNKYQGFHVALEAKLKKEGVFGSNVNTLEFQVPLSTYIEAQNKSMSDTVIYKDGEQDFNLITGFKHIAAATFREINRLSDPDENSENFKIAKENWNKKSQFYIMDTPYVEG